MDGKVFSGRYRVVREIGAALARRTYLATDPGGAQVVVSVMTPPSPEIGDAAERDIAAIAGVSHPGLAPIIEWGRDGADIFVVRQFVPGADLKTELGVQHRFASSAIARYGASAARALGALHDHGLVHGDVKTSNIVRMADDEVRVVDAGLGLRAVTPDVLAAASPEDVSYLAPERFEGAAATPSSDIYSLGVVLYELLTGHVPFQGATASDVAQGHLHAHPTAVEASTPDFLEALETVAMRALSKQPGDRYDSAQAMAADLDQVAAGPVQVPPTARRRVWPWVLAAVLVVLAAFGIAWGLGAFSGKVAVPDLTGMTLPEAQAAVASARLRVGQVTYSGAPVTGVATGSVASQVPAAGTRVDPRTSVDLVLAGVELAGVPDVVGMTQADAANTLKAAGFTVGTVSVAASSVEPSGSVLAQSPPSGTQAAKGSAVDLTIAEAATVATAVPNVVGMAQDQAVDTLADAGFGANTVAHASSSVASGSVISQDPVTGVTANPGSTVTIDVSTGPARASVPGVVGMTQANAVNALTAAGFKSRITLQTGGGTVGDVVAQSPAAGAGAAPGSTVVITVVQ